jgi:putative peptidoglycan lipid II flippase
MTLAAFQFHMPGLFFIALNRILAPAFYAQGDSKSPTLAGIISFGVNIGLAALLAGPLRGAGIALALSLASAVNTALLLVFLRRNPHIDVAGALRSALGYTFKLVLFSVIAVLPVLWLDPRLRALFVGGNRLISQGAPLAVNALVFGATGILLLLISGDRRFKAVIALILRRFRGTIGASHV